MTKPAGTVVVLGTGMTSALLPRWYEAIAGDHGDDDVASAGTAATTTVSPPGARLTVAAT